MKGNFLFDRLLSLRFFCVSEADICPGLDDLDLAISYSVPCEIGDLVEKVNASDSALIFVDATSKPELALRTLERLSARKTRQRPPLLIVLFEAQLDWLEKARQAGATGFLCADQPLALRKASLCFLLPQLRKDQVFSAPVLQWRWDRASRIMRLSAELAAQLDLPSEIKVNDLEDFTQFIHPDDRQHLLRQLRRMMITKLGFGADLQLIGPSGRVLPVHQSLQVMPGSEGEPDAMRAIITVKNRRRREDVSHHNHDIDSLTGLANLYGAQGFIDNALQAEVTVCVLILGVSRFERLNSLWGRSSADEVLRAIAQRLEQTLGAHDNENALLSRLGGTEFALILKGELNRDALSVVAQAMLAAFQSPFRLKEIDDIHLSARVGVSSTLDGVVTSDVLLRQAHVALSVAKNGEPNELSFFSPVHAVGQSSEDAVEQALRKAIERNELEIRYQPLVNIAARETCGFEALLRWRHPEFGLMSPQSFLPIAERAGLMQELSEWVLSAAVHAATDWPDKGREGLALSVNLSSEQFRRPDIVSRILAVVESAHFDPKRLVLELTETIVMEDMERSVTIMHQLKSHGIRIAIDDFGTGYSSLSYLKYLPFSILKIDRLFVEDLPGNAQDIAMLDAIVAMAKTLNMVIVAEGVEEEEQLQCLAQHGCDVAQGFLFTTPIAGSEISTFLKNQAA